MTHPDIVRMQEAEAADRAAHNREAKAKLVARIEELEAALRPFAVYAKKRNDMPMLGLGNTVHRIHGGTVHETEITLAHCQQALRLVPV